jgi:hypothetical protein
MTKQLEYSLIQAGYMILIAVVAATLAYAGNTIDGQGFLVAILVAVTPAIQRVYKGWEDGVRAREGEVLPSDVGAYLPPLATDDK